jgi:hypothetical protein
MREKIKEENQVVFTLFCILAIHYQIGRSEQFIYKITKNNLSHTIMIRRSLTVTSSCRNSNKSVSE